MSDSSDDVFTTAPVSLVHPAPATHELIAADAVWDAMRALSASDTFKTSEHLKTLGTVLYSMLSSVLLTELTTNQVLYLLQQNPSMSVHLAVHRVLP